MRIACVPARALRAIDENDENDARVILKEITEEIDQLDRDKLPEMLRGLNDRIKFEHSKDGLLCFDTKFRPKVGICWRPQRDSNSCYRRERAMS